MFWKYNSPSASQVDSFLEKENVSLNELLELEDIIQECKDQNKKLVEYLVSGDVLSNLIDLIIHEPPEDLEPTQRFKCAHVAAELLSCEVPQVNEKISCEEVLLDKLYSFLENGEAPLNPLLASFFSKAFGVLITRKSEQNWYSYQFTCLQVFEFLKKKEFVSHVLKHIGTSAISDLVLRLIGSVEGTNTKQGLLDWLNEKQLIENIISLLNDRHDRDTHDNASRLLIEILRVSRDGQYMPASDRCNDRLLATLENPATVELLLNTMFGSPDEDSSLDKHCPSESVLVNGISVLLALLENRKAVNLADGVGGETASSKVVASNHYDAGATYGAGESSSDSALSPEELAHQQVILDATIASILPRLKDFTALLVNPPNTTPIKTAAGVLDPPLGQARLHIAKLVSALLATNNLNANVKLIELKTLDKLLDLFFQYSLNNFLHAQVEICIKYAFCCVNPPSQASTQIAFDSSWSSKATADADDESKTGETEAGEGEAKVESQDTDGGSGEAPTDDVTVEEPAENTTAEKETSETESTPMDQGTSEEETKAEEEPKVEDAGEETKVENIEEEKATKEEQVAAEEESGELKINPLLVHLFSDCHLLNRVLDAWDENERQEQEPGFKRKGYMGHLTRIANVMHLSVENKVHESFSGLMAKLDDSTREKWSLFVSGRLAHVNERNTIVPHNSYSSNAMSSSEDEDTDFKDVTFPQESSLQQIYSDYQMQQMSDNLHDGYGFTEDEFNDNDDSSAKRVLRFGLEDSSSPSNKQAQQDLFESFCKTRFTCFPGDFEGDEKSKEDEDDEEDDDPWENKTREITFGSAARLEGAELESTSNLSPIKMSPSKAAAIVDASSPSSFDHVTCSSSDEEENTKVEVKSSAMDIEEGHPTGDDFWAEDVPADIAPVAMDIGNPWDSAPVAAPVEEKAAVVVQEAISEGAWAEFNDAEMVAVTETHVPEVKASEDEGVTADAEVPVVTIVASEESTA